MHYLCRFVGCLCFFASEKFHCFLLIVLGLTHSLTHSLARSTTENKIIMKEYNARSNGYQKNYEIIMGFRFFFIIFEECTKKLLCRSHDAQIHFNVAIYNETLQYFFLSCCCSHILSSSLSIHNARNCY